MLPKQYAWLAAEPGPRILTEFLKLYGTQEKIGSGSNPTIIAWAEKTGMRRQGYNDDAIPWCGLATAYAALQAGWNIPLNPLAARNWLEWGTDAATAKVSPGPSLGDVMVFWRGSKSGWSGHVGVYVGEDSSAYHILGGNQSDAVNIKRMDKSRFLGARRCPWRINQPANVRPVRLAATGSLSTNEA